VLRSWLCQT